MMRPDAHSRATMLNKMFDKLRSNQQPLSTLELILTWVAWHVARLIGSGIAVELGASYWPASIVGFLIAVASMIGYKVIRGMPSG